MVLIWALVCWGLIEGHLRASTLLNVQFGTDQMPLKTGPAAVGNSDADFWNRYSRDDGSGGFRSYGVLPGLKWANGEASSIELRVSNGPGAWGNGHPDPMYGLYIYPFDGRPLTVTLVNLPEGTYAVYAYGHGGPPDVQNTAFELLSAGGSYGLKRTSSRPGWLTTNWTESVHYTLFTNVAVKTNVPLTLLSRPDAIPQAVINGLQLVRLSESLPSEAPPFPLPDDSVPSVEPGGGGGGGGGPTNGPTGGTAGRRVPTTVLDQPDTVLNLQLGADGSALKKGWAATGQSDEDFWNLYSRDDGRGGFKNLDTIAPLYWASGRTSSIIAEVRNAPGAWENGHLDPMFRVYLYPLSFDPVVTVALHHVPAGLYSLYLYGHGGPPPEQNTEFQLASGEFQYGPSRTSDGPNWASTEWTEGVQYVRFTHVIVQGELPLVIRAGPASSQMGHINGLQLVRESALGSALFVPAERTFTNSLRVVILGGVAGDEIRFTTDGTSPVSTSPLYTRPLQLEKTTRIIARLYKEGVAVGEEISAHYRRIYVQPNDGIAAEWRLQHFGEGYLYDERAAVHADPDGDGADNLEEYFQGSNPLDAASGFLVRTRLVPSISWRSEPGKRYQVFRKASIGDPEWKLITEMEATTPFSRFTDVDVPSENSIYTVRPVVTP